MVPPSFFICSIANFLALKTDSLLSSLAFLSPLSKLFFKSCNLNSKSVTLDVDSPIYFSYSLDAFVISLIILFKFLFLILASSCIFVDVAYKAAIFLSISGIFSLVHFIKLGYSYSGPISPSRCK